MKDDPRDVWEASKISKRVRFFQTIPTVSPNNFLRSLHNPRLPKHDFFNKNVDFGGPNAFICTKFSTFDQQEPKWPLGCSKMVEYVRKNSEIVQTTPKVSPNTFSRSPHNPRLPKQDFYTKMVNFGDPNAFIRTKCSNF